MGDKKADAGGTPNRNGGPIKDQFTLVAGQIRAAADQLKAGRYEVASDQGSVALNQALAQTFVTTEETASDPAIEALSESGSPGADPLPSHPGRLSQGLVGYEAQEVYADRPATIELTSAVAVVAPSSPPAPMRPIMTGSPATLPVIDLSNAAAEVVQEQRPNGTRKPIIGRAVGLPQTETAASRIAEAFPDPRPAEAGANGAAKAADGPTLGMYLIASRERLGVKREDAARDTRIPANYVRMMESNDYSMIADQLYMLPFLRRYADYLELDSEEVAIRFVREVQRSENTPVAGLPHQVLDDEPGASNRWVVVGAIAVIGLVAASFFFHQRHHMASETTASEAQSVEPMGAPAAQPPNGGSQNLAADRAPSNVAAANVRVTAAKPVKANPQPKASASAFLPPPPPGGTE
ncbi:MAG: helix-turn-helix domain-containing protein [Candidatus Binataceae bacterium]